MRTVKEIFRSYAVLDAKGIHIGGSDKQSNHNYGDAYESLFPDREAVKLVLEVGVADGSSMLAFKEIFPNAIVVGMDIHVAQRAVEHGMEFYIGDQRVQEDCRRAANNRQFDLIVEDAYHSVANTMLTLFWLWPFVKPGGLYIVEEWANIGNCRENIKALFANVEIVDTIGPFGGVEPLVVLRKNGAS